MIMLLFLFFLMSVVFFYFTRKRISNTLIRILLSVVIFVALSTAMVAIVSKGHSPPPDAKNVDFEEMKKARQKFYGNGE